MTQESRWFVSDRAIERPDQDRFGHVDVAAQLADVIETFEATGDSATIGLIGGFGTGKSSIGNLLAAGLRGHTGLQVITLSGERHTGVARQRALVYSFAEALQQDAGVCRDRVDKILGRVEVSEDVDQADLSILPFADFISQNWRKALRPLLYSAASFAALYVVGIVIALIVNAASTTEVNVPLWPLTTSYLAVPLVTSLGVGIAGLFIPWIHAAFTPGHRTRRRPRAEAADEFERVFGDLAQLCKKRLVVVVDDIDRLPPSEVLDALATIKSFQAVPQKNRPIFVIACDDQVVRRAIEAADPGLSPVEGSSRKAAEEYLNKLFVVRQPLPPPLREDMTSFALNLLTSPESPHAGRQHLGDDLPRVLDVLIHDGVTEPRHVVRLLNAFFADYRLAWIREGTAARLGAGSVTGAPLTLARLTVLRVDFPQAYAAIREEHDLLAALDKHVLGEKLDRSEEDLILRARLSRSRGTNDHDATPKDWSGGEPEVSAAASITASGTPDVDRVLSDFLRRTAGFVEHAVPLGPFLYLSQTEAGKVLGSRRAEDVRRALENRDVNAVLARLNDDPSIAEATVEHIIATLNGARPGLPLTNATRTAAACLAQTPPGASPRLAAKISEVISREPNSTPEPTPLVDVIRLAPARYHDGLIEKLINFGDGEDSTSRSEAISQLAVSDRDGRLPAALAGYFTDLPDNAGYSTARSWIPRAASVDCEDRNRIYGPEFYAGIIRCTVGENDEAIDLPEIHTFLGLLQAATEESRASGILLDAVKYGLATDGVMPAWFAMQSLEHLTVSAKEATDVLSAVANALTSVDADPHAQTFISAMHIVGAIAESFEQQTRAMRAEDRSAVVTAVVAATQQNESEIAQISAAKCATSLAPLWPDSLTPAVAAFGAVLDTHRVIGDPVGQAAQDALVCMVEHLDADVRDQAAEALLSPLTSATDEDDPAVRMAIEAEQQMCRNEPGRTQVASHTTQWRKVFDQSLSNAINPRPKIEALQVAAVGGALLQQQEIVSRLNSILANGQPSLDVAAQALTAIPWEDSLRRTATSSLVAHWDAIGAEIKVRMLDAVTIWPNEGESPDSSLIDKLAEFAAERGEGPREPRLTTLWPWASRDTRAQILATAALSESFVSARLSAADEDERFATMLAAARTTTFNGISEALATIRDDATSGAATKFISQSLADDDVSWSDDQVRSATLLLFEPDAEKLADEAVTKLQRGAAHAARASSLLAWLRLRCADGLSRLDETFTTTINEILPSANDDLARRLGRLSHPINSRVFAATLRTMRKDSNDSQRSRAAAEAFEYGRREG